MTEPAAAAELSRLAGSPPRGGTEVRLLRDDLEAFPRDGRGDRRRANDEPVRELLLRGDTTRRDFAEALSAAARRGVDVKVLYHPIGTMMVKGGSSRTSFATTASRRGLSDRSHRSRPGAGSGPATATTGRL